MSDVITELANEANDKAVEIARLKAENDKLREQIHWLKKGDILHVLTDQEYIDQCERERLMQVSIDALDKENAKLREWCSDFWKWADPPFALKSGTFDEYMTLVERAVELGVEVNR